MMRRPVPAPEQGPTSVLSAAVVVAALGYFVDIYDLILVSVVRKPSLLAMGVPDVATTVPNFVRGLVVTVTLSFAWLKPQPGLVQAALAVGAFWFVLAIAGALRLRETFGVDLDYVEGD